MKLTNDKASFRDLQSVKKIEKKEKKTNSKPEFISKKSLSDIKASAIAAMFLLPAIGVRSCYNPQEKKENKIEYTDKISTELSTEDIYEKYTDFKPQRIYVVKKGDTPDKIAQNHNVSTMRLLAENNLTTKSIIQPNDELWIPESYTVKNIENLDDIAKLVKLDKQYLEDLCKFETFSNKIYYDANGNATIGVGHLVKPEELNKYQGKTLTDKEVYELLAQDMFERDLDFETILEGDAYYKMPIALKSQVLDLIFNKGLGAVTSNEKLINALNNGDYVTAVANLNQDYSIVTNAKGEKVKKHLSGLSKRRLYNMSQASKIFEKGIPDEVLKSAKAVYSRGLVTMEQECDNGHIPKTAYENVKKEYQESAYRWFDGEIGKRPKLFSLKRKNKKETNENVVVEKVPEHSLPKQVDNSTTIKVNGENTKWTVNSLHEDWQKTASRCKRYVKRPAPEIDKNGNLTAMIKVLEPNGNGEFANNTIIINPGHGGAVNNKEKNGSLNVNFDPGTSNAKMSAKNKNLETNTFIGNGGKSLEEWVVNQRIADVLAEKLQKAGAKVIYVQGSVYSAQDAIRKIQKDENVDMIVSLHSNSDGNKRGIYVIANNRGGIDKEDEKLAKKIEENLNQHSWFRGITSQTAQSLGVLSANRYSTSNVPAVLIETGNLKNEKDVANLNSRDFKNQLINSIIDGMAEYIN